MPLLISKGLFLPALPAASRGRAGFMKTSQSFGVVVFFLVIILDMEGQEAQLFQTPLNIIWLPYQT